MEAKVLRLRDRELAKLLRMQGNYDYMFELEGERIYVRKGVDKVWISLSHEQDVVLYVSLGKRSLKEVVEKIVREYIRTNLEAVTYQSSTP